MQQIADIFFSTILTLFDVIISYYTWKLTKYIISNIKNDLPVDIEKKPNQNQPQLFTGMGNKLNE